MAESFDRLKKQKDDITAMQRAHEQRVVLDAVLEVARERSLFADEDAEAAFVLEVLFRLYPVEGNHG